MGEVMKNKDLVKDTLKVVIEKSKKVQTSDWLQRPLSEKQLNYAKEDDDKERIDYWENQVEIRLKKHNFIDSFINKFFDKVITNKDFMEFKDKLKMELETI